MTFTIMPMTAEEFDQYALLPENDDKLLEYIVGEIFNKMPSNPYASKISARFVKVISIFVDDNDLGHVTTEAGGYKIGFGERYAPDVAYVSKDRQSELNTSGYNDVPPDLAVEVEYPTDLASEKRLRYKVTHYLNVGTTVWVVYPEAKTVEVYVPGQSVQFLSEKDTLTGGAVLQGFSVPLSEVFK
ncbi:MAG: Uma2 family endonuclease [Anaerolineae bacterium]|nr:Uma2 family endonuclease [Anaerolineae bacterium]